MKKTILILLLALCLCLAGCGNDKGELSLGRLLSDIELEAGDSLVEEAPIEHIKIKKRVAQYSLVESYGLKLGDYLGEVYNKDALVIVSTEPLDTEKCRLYRVIDEINQRYLIKKDSKDELSLWRFEEFCTDFDTDYGKALAAAYEEVFPGCDMSKASDKELRKLIHGTGHELLVASEADANVVFQARSHLDRMRLTAGEGELILGLGAEEYGSLKLGTPCTLYCFDADGQPSGEHSHICPVLYRDAIVGLINLSPKSGGGYRCSLARSYGPAMEELRFSQSLNFDKGIVLARVEDKVIVTDGEKALLLEDLIAPGQPSITMDKVEKLSPVIRESVAADLAEITRNLG